MDQSDSEKPITNQQYMELCNKIDKLHDHVTEKTCSILSQILFVFVYIYTNSFIIAFGAMLLDSYLCYKLKQSNKTNV